MTIEKSAKQNQNDQAYNQLRTHMRRKKFTIPRHEHTRAYGIEPGSDTYKDYIDDED